MNEILLKGLSSSEAAQRLAKDGPNVLPKPKKVSFIKRFFESLCDKLIIILLISAFMSFAADLIVGETTADAFLILLIVVVNTLIAVFQQTKAQKAIDALSSLTPSKATVVRDGVLKRIDSSEIVVGDLIYVEKGYMVPADMRIVEQTELYADESMITGESMPVPKTADEVPTTNHIAEMHNMLHSSTFITSGKGYGIVTAVGANTFVGSIASMLKAEHKTVTPLQQRLSKTGSMLGNCALGICAAIFVVALIRGMPPAETFVTSVSLAVAAIPEGLPAIVTVVLSTGVKTLASGKAVVRSLPAVETLGSATVICTDKTGTLTQNKMTVTAVVGNAEAIKDVIAGCPGPSGGTEDALIAFCGKQGQKPIKEIPFDSERKYLAAVQKSTVGYIYYMRGAPDAVLTKCTNGAEYLPKSAEMAKQGLRVVAFAVGKSEQMPSLGRGGLTCVGLTGLLDPLREGTRAAVQACRRAGIKTVMITGDHKDTAIAIARMAGIYKDGDGVYTESELALLGDADFAKAAMNATVFARTTPSFKLRIVTALQNCGEVVAMTGDGVNDAPALKKADIGCAMGKSGTDVAKEASDLVLTDDDFGTIARAVAEGRGLMANIRRSVHFLLACNIGEIITVLALLLLGKPSPLGAVQLLWINLVTDSLPAIALGLERTDPDVMNQKPIGRRAPLFDKTSVLEMAFEGLFIGLVSLTAYLIGSFDSPAVGKTMCFAVLSVSQLMHCFDMRTRKPMSASHLPRNAFMLPAFIVCLAMQLAVMLLPSLTSLFGCEMLSPWQWAVVAGLSAALLPICEVYKLLTVRKY